MLAKEELGKDAIVMNIKTVSPRGIYKLFKKPLVEITAAVDENISYRNEKIRTAPITPVRKPVRPDIIIEDEPTAKEKSFQNNTNDSAQSAIEAKLNNLQNLLEKQLKDKEKQLQEEEKQ